jgi:hypothetical protein
MRLLAAGNPVGAENGLTSCDRYSWTNLGVFGGVGAGEQRHPAQHANEHQVDEYEGPRRAIVLGW